MSTTIDYDIKRAMPFLTKDCRWNVLTVLILHANGRNRCWPSMDTIAEMAAGNNRKRATRAKQWLQKHGAFTIVAFDKRVEEESKLQPRQHIYQMTGHIKACRDKRCDCGGSGEVFSYLYLPKNVPIDTTENVPIETFNSVPIDTGSISIEVIPVEVGAHAAKIIDDGSDTLRPTPEQIVQMWLKTAAKHAPLVYSHPRCLAAAATLLGTYPALTLDDVRICTLTQCKNRTTDYMFSFLVEDLSGYMARKAVQPAPSPQGLDDFSKYRLEMMKQEKAEREAAS